MFRSRNTLSHFSVGLALAALLMSSALARAEDPAPAAAQAPANPAAKNDPQPQPTQWSGSEDLGGYCNLTFQFYPDGRAVMLDSRTVSDGVWRQNGNQVTLWFSAGRVVYTGTINGGELSGTAQNVCSCWSFCVSSVAFSGPLQPPIQWSGSENLCNYASLTFQLYPGGRAVMLDAQRMSEGIWLQNGQQMTLRFSGGRVVYTGTVFGNAMSGTASNQCTTWSWNANRQ